MTETKRSIFRGMQILSSHWIKEHALVVDDGIIKAIIPENMIEHHLPAQQYTFPSSAMLIPGLIDLHIHGTHGKDVMDGSEASLVEISRMLAQEGITGYLATTMTASGEQLEIVLQSIPSAAQTDKDGAAILGIHLEGPFISKDKMGAQKADAVQLPDMDALRHWQKLAQGMIKLITLAPELPDAIDFIKGIRAMDIIASIGHTNATYAETMEAIAAGCTQATHLFNAMRGMQQREPGAAGALLLSDKINAELIVDGVHLHPAMVELAYTVKGKDNLLLVTDAMRAKCMGDGCYELGGQEVQVKHNKATLADGTLAGSVLRMPQAIQNMLKFTHCSLEEAIQMASYNPARVLGLAPRKGSIEIGKDADLAVLDMNGAVLLTMREGREIFKAKT